MKSSAILKVVPVMAPPHSSAGDQPDDVNAEILAIVRAGVLGRRDASAHRLVLKDKARLFTGFDHFKRLCLHDLRAAFLDDRRERSRMTKNRRLTWLAMFRYYAAHAGIDKSIEIVALDRQGNYACEMVDKVRQDDWSKFVRLGKQFGITEEELHALYRSGQAPTVRGRFND